VGRHEISISALTVQSSAFGVQRRSVASAVIEMYVRPPITWNRSLHERWPPADLPALPHGIRQYERATYYVDRWKPEYKKWADMLAGLNQGPGHEVVAWNSALIYDMIFTQPVYDQLPLLKPKTVLMVGTSDYHGHRQRHRSARHQSTGRPLRRAWQGGRSPHPPCPVD
jgi:hypothetical protein